MKDQAVGYFPEAFDILKSNIIYVFILALLASGFYLDIVVSKDLNLLFFTLLGVSLIIVKPLYYGQFIEIIQNGRKNTWGRILKTYWAKFVMLSIILGMPVAVISMITPEFKLLKFAIALIIEIASIYMLPLVLMSKGFFGPLKLGILCLLGNFRFSISLVVIAVISFFLSQIFGYAAAAAGVDVSMYKVLSVILFFFGTAADFFIFISAVLILKDRLFCTEEIRTDF